MSTLIRPDHIAYVGLYAEAQSLKILNNLAEAVNLVSAAEVISLAEQQGFDYGTMKSVFSFARGRSAYMDLLLDRLIHTPPEVAVSIEIRLKDLILGLDIIKHLGAQSILIEEVYKIFKNTEKEFGLKSDQTTCYYTVQSKQKNTKFIDELI